MADRVAREPMASDVVEALEAIQALEDQPDWKPLFYPAAFVRSHLELKTTDFMLEVDVLRAWGRRATIVRKNIDQRVEGL